MNKLTVFDIDFSFMGNEDRIYPVVLQDDINTVLIDCGYIGSLELIENAMLSHGVDPDTLTHIIITHHDHDHMGALHNMKEKRPYIKVVASMGEEPYISGKEKSMRLTQAEEMQKILPEEQKSFGEKFCEILRSVKTTDVDIVIKDGDILDFCGGCRIIGTSGHTPGHISLYIEKLDTVIAGDAAALKNGELVLANPQFTLNMENAQKSLQRIKEMNAKQIICYHGGVYLYS